MTISRVHLHSDYSILRDALVSEDYTLESYSDFTEWWLGPQGGRLCVDLPQTDPYESVRVEFHSQVTTDELRLLRFPEDPE